MQRALTLVLVVAAACSTPPRRVSLVLGAVDAPGPGSARHYAFNAPPLRDAEFAKLPVGAIEARGWLRTQLELQNSGFHGQLTEISKFLRKEGNAWLARDGLGDHGWEEVPYWLKGFGDCAYLLRDEAHIAEAQAWIEAVLASQGEDGFFGPRKAAATVSSTQGVWDLWPNMPMLDALRSWCEFSGDERVPPFMARYFRWQLALPDEQFVPPYWQHLRAYDNLWSVYWLYNRTSDEALKRDLLALGEKLYRCAARWEDGVIDGHNVNICQGFGGATFFSQQSLDELQRASAERNFRAIRADYGQVPGGLFGADENARPGCSDPRQAIETCGMVEMMNSCQRLLLATGDLAWADRCEDVAFNSLPAALTDDLRALRYLTAPNLAVSDRRPHNPGFENGGPMLCFDPNAHRCCQHNFGHGWPYLAENLWLATRDGGACLVTPLASEARIKVGARGDEVRLECVGDYPFKTSFEIVVHSAARVDFPLYVRVPGWATSVSIGSHGAHPERVAAQPDKALVVRGPWRPGERVRVEFETQCSLQRWPGNANSASVRWGPLTYSLAIDTERVRSGGSDAWPAFELLPKSPWNYALVDDQGHGPMTAFGERALTPGVSPWTRENAPRWLSVRGRRVPNWQLDATGLVAPLERSPVRTRAPLETLELIPMGAARLRISAFPVVGDGPDALEWPAPPPLPSAPHPTWKVSSSHCYGEDTPSACSDGWLPASSSDRTLQRLTWWPHAGTSEWVQYDFDAPTLIEASDVYWYEDSATGRCALPLRWKLSFRDAHGTWSEIPNASYEAAAGDRWCAATFDALEATALRLEVDLQPEKSAGVLEWRVLP